MSPRRILLGGLGLAFAALLAARPAGAVEGARYLLTSEGVRSAGLAGAFGAVQGSPESLWYNPAGLPGGDGVEANLTHASFPGAWDSDQLLVTVPYHWRHYLGLLYHRNATEDTFRDALGNEGGQFEVSQSVLGAAYAYHAARWSAGAQAKSATEVVANRSASAMLYDLGLQADLRRDRVLVGLAVQNLGAAPDLGNGPPIDAPTLVRASTELRFAGDVSSLSVLADYRYHLVTAANDVSVGLEYAERYQDARLGLRAGWDLSQSDLGGSSGLALGLGFGYGPVGFDYAWTPHEALGSQQRIALTLLWDLRAKQRERDLATYIGPTYGNEEATPTPTPTPVPVKDFHESNAGARLDKLLAATPTPLPTPTPAVEERHEAPKGILGFFANLFGGSPKKADTTEPAGPKPSLLQSVFHFLGFGSSAPTEAPATPEEGRQDAFHEATPVPTPKPAPTPDAMQRLKGDSQALPSPTPTPPPVVKQVKSWMKF